MREVVIELSGEIDMANAWIVPARVAAAIEQGDPVRVVLDLRELTFIDCAGIQALLESQLLAEGSGSALRVSNPSLLTCQIMGVLGVADRLLGVRPSARHLRRRPSWQTTRRTRD